MSGKKLSDDEKGQRQEFARYLECCNQTGIAELLEVCRAIGKLRDVSVGRIKKQACMRALIELMVSQNCRIPGRSEQKPTKIQLIYELIDKLKAG